MKPRGGEGQNGRLKCPMGFLVIDVLGGWSEDLEAKMKELVGERTKHVLKCMQKVVLSHSLNIARSFKDIAPK